MTPSEQLKAQRLACPTLVLTQHREACPNRHLVMLAGRKLPEF